ncbi:Protein FAR1-RELATED SEQUENCE 5 [Glycine max]|nr:Protein FAR1-RELATED SEQUENCE 5 [Glycine max]
MCKVRGCYFWCFICLKMMWKILKIKVITEDVFDYSHRIRKYMFPNCAFVCQVRSLVNVMDLDDIMSELESSDNFFSLVNGDGDNDVTEVYPNDDDDQHDVGDEDEDEVDSEIEGCAEKKKKAGVVVKQCFVFMCIFVRDDGHRKMFASDIMQVENYRKVGIRPPHMYTTFANRCGGYDKVGFIRKDIYNEEGHMRKQHTSDASGALKYLHYLRKKDPMLYVLYIEDKGSRLQRLFWCDTESQLLYELLEQLLVAMKGKAPCSIITDGDLAMRNAITRVMSGVFHRLCAWHLLRNALSHVRDKQVLKWLKNLRLGDFEVVEFDEKWKEMVSTFELEGNTWIAELYATLVEVSRQVCEAAYHDEDEYDKMLHFLSNENYPLETYKWKHHSIIVDVDATLIAHEVLCHPCLTKTYK